MPSHTAAGGRIRPRFPGAVCLGLTLAVTALGAGPLSAQLPTVSELEERFNQAELALEGEQAAEEAVRGRFERLLATFRDDPGPFYQAADELNRITRRVEEKREALEEARGQLRQGLEGYRRSLGENLLVASIDERAGIEVELRSVNRHLAELTRPVEPLDPARSFPRMMRLDPRDNRQTIEEKIEVAELNLAQRDSQIVSLGERIGELDVMIENQQRMDNFLRANRIFDNSPPTSTTPTSAGGRGLGVLQTDSATAVEDRPLPEQRDALQATLELVRQYRQGVVKNIDELRAALRGSAR